MIHLNQDLNTFTTPSTMNPNSSPFPEYLVDIDHPQFPTVFQHWLYNVMNQITDDDENAIVSYTQKLTFDLHIKPLFPNPDRKLTKLIRDNVTYLKRTRFNDIIIGVPVTYIGSHEMRALIADFLHRKRKKDVEIYTLSAHSFTYLADNLAGDSSDNLLDERIPNLHLIHISYSGPKEMFLPELE